MSSRAMSGFLTSPNTPTNSALSERTKSGLSVPCSLASDVPVRTSNGRFCVRKTAVSKSRMAG